MSEAQGSTKMTETMLNTTAHVLEREGCPLHYWLSGPEGRPLVVFTHGLCIDHRAWKYQLPVIAQTYRVLTWDVRGQGLSQPMGRTFSMHLAAQDLLAIMDALGYAQAVFVGHSNGTYIHQELVLRSPQRVQALVMTDGTCITWPRSRVETWFIHNAAKAVRLFPYETLKKAGLPNDSARQDVQAYIYEAFSMISRRDYVTLCERVAACVRSMPGYRITQPMLLVHGEQDRLGDIAKIAPQWAAREANCRYEVIPNASHMAMMDNPEHYNRLLLDFLARWAPVTPAGQ
jgi:pimeloyl-ACP methyl ester carboxylesterase